MVRTLCENDLIQQIYINYDLCYSWLTVCFSLHCLAGESRFRCQWKVWAEFVKKF